MHFDHPIFIALIAIAALLRWLSQRAESSQRQANEAEPKAAQPSIAQPRDNQSDEERTRRFLEALGQPATSKPPPKITQRPEAQKRTVAPRRPIGPVLPPLTTRPPEVPKDSRPPVIAAERQKTLPPTATFAPGSAYEVRTVESTKRADDRPALLFDTLTPAAGPSEALRSLLRTPSAVRNAIVLREILGEPRGLRALESA